MNKLHSLLNEAEKRFDEKFIYDYFDDSGLYILGNRKQNLPAGDIEIKDFYRTTLKQALQAILEAAPKEYTFEKHKWDDGVISTEPVEDKTISLSEAEGFNQGREQSLSIIREFLRGEG